jgi:hypothetical protein
MNKNQINYKLFKSFKLPLSPEDRVMGNISVPNENISNLTITIDELNFDFLTFSSSRKIPHQLVNLELQRPKLFFKRDKVKVQGNITLTKRKQNQSLHKYQYILYIENNDSFTTWVENFISQFSKKRLHSYLIASATRMKELDYDDISETVSLLISSFQDMAKEKDSLKITDNLQLCTKIIDCEKARIWLYSPSSNTLCSKYSSENDEDEIKKDYREGIIGKVFSTGEVVNINKSLLLTAFYEKSMSVLAAPITNRFHKTVGVLELRTKNKNLRFRSNDELLIRMLSICFSAQFQMFNPVNAASKLHDFNPSQKKKIFDLENIAKDKLFIQIIQKVKNLKENILINYSSLEYLNAILDELITSSHFHDWKKIHLSSESETLKMVKNFKNTIIVLENVDKLSKVDQEYLVEFIDPNQTWVISTYRSTDLDKTVFTMNFWNKFARHHLNFRRNKSFETIDVPILELVKSIQNISSFEEKTDYLSSLLGISSEKEKEAA